MTHICRVDLIYDDRYYVIILLFVDFGNFEDRREKIRLDARAHVSFARASEMSLGR